MRRGLGAIQKIHVKKGEEGIEPFNTECYGGEGDVLAFKM